MEDFRWLVAVLHRFLSYLKWIWGNYEVLMPDYASGPRATALKEKRRLDARFCHAPQESVDKIFPEDAADEGGGNVHKRGFHVSRAAEDYKTHYGGVSKANKLRDAFTTHRACLCP